MRWILDVEIRVKGVSHWMPGYASLVIHFDPQLTNVSIVQDWFWRLAFLSTRV